MKNELQNKFAVALLITSIQPCCEGRSCTVEEVGCPLTWTPAWRGSAWTLASPESKHKHLSVKWNHALVTCVLMELDESLTFGSVFQQFLKSSAKLAGHPLGMVNLWNTHRCRDKLMEEEFDNLELILFLAENEGRHSFHVYTVNYEAAASSHCAKPGTMGTWKFCIPVLQTLSNK